ncbi:MAG: glycosyltransferase family 39 protein [Acidobacteriaceae bacterium]|nr:glycosyltransferase family 39 protein [Acidobacteriaceae bacterium]
MNAATQDVPTLISAESLATRQKALGALLLCILVLLVAVDFRAPTFIDEGLTMVEVAGQEAQPFPTGVRRTDDLRDMRLESNAPLSEVLQSLGRVDRHPPLYYVLLWTWTRLTGLGLYACRALSVAFLIATIYLYAKWMRSVLHTAIFAFSPLTLLFGTIARSYMLAVFFTVLTLYLLDSAVRKRPWAPIAAAISGAAAVWCHYFAAFPIVIAFSGLLVLHWRNERSRLIRSLGLFALLIAPAMWRASTQASTATPTVYKGWPTIYEIVRSFLRAPVNAFQLFPGPLDLVFSALFLAVLAGAAWTFRRRSPRVQISLVILLVHALMLILISAAKHQSLSTPRYLGLVSPFYCILIADAVTRAKRFRRAATIFVFVAIAGSSTLEAGKLFHIGKLQQQVFGRKPSRTLIVAGGGMMKWAMPETLVSDLPRETSFLVLQSPQDIRSAVALLGTYEKTFFCPTPEDTHIEGYDRFSSLFPPPRTRLFREFYCSARPAE